MQIEENKEILDWVFMDDEDFFFLYLMEYIVGSELRTFHTRFAEFMKQGVKEDIASTFV